MPDQDAGQSPLTKPFYPRPSEGGIHRAKESVFRVLQCVAPRSWIDGPALVRFAMSNKGKITVAEAMWAIHEIADAGGFMVWLQTQAPRGAAIVTEINPPAGIQMAEGTLHVGGPPGTISWGDLDFEPNHQRIEEIRRPPAQSRPANANIKKLDDAQSPTANHLKLFPNGVPENGDLRDLAVAINAQRGNGKSKSRIAREVTDEERGKDKKAKSLLSQLRRLRREGRVNL